MTHPIQYITTEWQEIDGMWYKIDKETVRFYRARGGETGVHYDVFVAESPDNWLYTHSANTVIPDNEYLLSGEHELGIPVYKDFLERLNELWRRSEVIKVIEEDQTAFSTGDTSATVVVWLLNDSDFLLVTHGCTPLFVRGIDEYTYDDGSVRITVGDAEDWGFPNLKELKS